jgi:ABC-type protease/lipase transport system fused ATPase/permease subunit
MRKTVILISHRPSIIRETNKLLVLRDGMVSAFGPTDQVLKDLAQFKAQQEAQAAARAKAEAESRAQNAANITTVTQIKDVPANSNDGNDSASDDK